MTELIAVTNRVMDRFSEGVQLVGGQQWHNSTPCGHWDVREVINHVTVEQLWVPPLLQGATVDEIGDRFNGDQLGTDPIAAWSAASTEALACFSAPGALDGEVSLSAGITATKSYCWEMTVDAFIHAWDVLRGIGADEVLDPELVDVISERLFAKADAAGDAEVPTAGDAPSKQTRLLAKFGREG
ncbi:MAG: TIGR03086 family metal-binding protein [Actinomycetes bacterium]